MSTLTQTRSSLSQILKWPLILCAVVVVLRVVTEQLGAPAMLNSSLSVVALHTAIFPVYFAARVAKSGEPRPYATLFKLVTVYVVLARLMLLPVYWLARVYEWTQPRFFGLWGPGVDNVTGFVALPVLTAVFWIVASVVFGGIIGSIVIAAIRRSSS